jgi:hypothetical protein
MGMTNKKGKDKYGDSGYARMTGKKYKSRFPSGMTNKKATHPFTIRL